MKLFKKKKEQPKEKPYEEWTYEEKLNDFFKKHGTNIDSKLLTFILKTEFSDIIFEQHQKGCYGLNMVLISVQFILVFIGLIGSVFGLHLSSVICGISIAIMGFVVANNSIHDMAWSKAKRRLKELEIAIDVLPVRVGTEVVDELEKKYNIDLESMIEEQKEGMGE